MRQSYTEAFELFRDAAEKGHVGAQDSLGLAYAMGRGVEQSYTEAFKWFRAAAEKGDANAQYNLGLLYFKGHGVKQSYTEAFKLFRDSAEKGHVGAQYNLGISYANGWGVKQRKLFKSTLNNRLHRNLACVIDKSSRGAKLKRAFEELPKVIQKLLNGFVNLLTKGILMLCV